MATMYGQQESIYNLIPQEEVKQEKQARYTSKFRGNVKVEEKTKKTSSKTMGPAKVELKKPEEFHKKHSKEPQLPPKTKFSYPDEETKRPAVPKRDEKPLMGLKSNKNFVNTNAVENIMSVPKKPAANFVDTVNGATHPLTPSGLMPKYVKKKGYGEVPTYLQQRNEEVQRAQEEYDEYIKEHYRRGAMKCLTEEERKAIMDGLKKNWEEIHHQYQGLSVVTDTAPKKARKERMEAEMKQLERDIELLEKHKVIYISNH
ncbi:enkurin [Strongylocentrotus purpuratus]|uniref:Enkurin domain-containing protein n=1 Tax=Strongylocentrotus purpuratus TaxID=7668 RepID=A0A7M7RFW1_STRPU|nr:enkurin-like [Strongylocentrotus purpuratus]XP_784094.1 enkurin [Strongylocentrotus purpuratus]8SNB_2A Chain 2A, Enkurin domain-containing protein [Strongylocentrotus purpuratus]8SNB_2B Chain 2B, Enkurin domain-containing protein [Strongylocentrotus purpuratus]8SNB_2C Chain 2C, Enkurin domain-containing protein [Strongylocentrotus purpuratus]8SNB_2D Chain 2D, Enkurin domain-containing protein [Strongylocentrotus purpuratus]|eukprot:XP_784094.1 PREDICTED: enkurin [Strongylocentrotus purpuratus]